MTEISHGILLPNAAYAGMTPRLLSAACHDGTPFITITCGGCDAEMHVHESQIKDAPAEAAIGTRCRCGHMVVFEAGQLHEGFAQLRRDGWIK
jgi:hypothetical protein